MIEFLPFCPNYMQKIILLLSIYSHTINHINLCIYIYTHTYIYIAFISPEYKKNSINILMQLLLEVYKVKF